MQRSRRVYADERVRRDFIAELLAPMLVFGGVALGVGNRSDLWGHVELFFRRGGGTGLVGVGVGVGGGVEIVEIGLEGERVEGRRVGLGVQNVVDFGFHFELEGVELLEKGAGSEREREKEKYRKRTRDSKRGWLCRSMPSSFITMYTRRYSL